MSRGGHFFAALAVGSGTWALDPSWDRLILAASLIAGASLPDQIEGVIGFDALGGRHSILPHRSISHWPPVWIALGALALWLLPRPFSTIVGGLAFGALLHLAIDIGSPTGIPSWFPRGIDPLATAGLAIVPTSTERTRSKNGAFSRPLRASQFSH